LSQLLQNNLKFSLEAARLLQDLLSHDPFSRQPVTVSHSSCVKPALPAGASPSSATSLKPASAGDQQSPAGAENGDHASDSQLEEGRLTRAVLPSLIALARLASLLSSHIDQSLNHMAELQHTILDCLSVCMCKI